MNYVSQRSSHTPIQFFMLRDMIFLINSIIYLNNFICIDRNTPFGYDRLILAKMTNLIMNLLHRCKITGRLNREHKVVTIVLLN